MNHAPLYSCDLAIMLREPSDPRELALHKKQYIVIEATADTPLKLFYVNSSGEIESVKIRRSQIASFHLKLESLKEIREQFDPDTQILHLSKPNIKELITDKTSDNHAPPASIVARILKRSAQVATVRNLIAMVLLGKDDWRWALAAPGFIAAYLASLQVKHGVSDALDLLTWDKVTPRYASDAIFGLFTGISIAAQTQDSFDQLLSLPQIDASPEVKKWVGWIAFMVAVVPQSLLYFKTATEFNLKTIKEVLQSRTGKCLAAPVLALAVLGVKTNFIYTGDKVADICEFSPEHLLLIPYIASGLAGAFSPACQTGIKSEQLFTNGTINKLSKGQVTFLVLLTCIASAPNLFFNFVVNKTTDNLALWAMFVSTGAVANFLPKLYSAVREEAKDTTDEEKTY